VSRPLSEDEAALVARGLAEFRDAHRWERLGHKYLPHRCAWISVVRPSLMLPPTHQFHPPHLCICPNIHPAPFCGMIAAVLPTAKSWVCTCDCIKPHSLHLVLRVLCALQECEDPHEAVEGVQCARTVPCVSRHHGRCSAASAATRTLAGATDSRQADAACIADASSGAQACCGHGATACTATRC